MKKRIILPVILCMICSVYFIIPNIIVIKRSVQIDKSDRALYRSLSKWENWKKWWPGNSSQTGQKLIFHNHDYILKDLAFNAFFVDIFQNNLRIPSSITYLPVNKDSVKLEWEAKVPTSYNPFTRIKIFLNTKELYSDIDQLMSKMQSYCSGTFNTYGIDIKREFVKDSSLIATHDSSNSYPTPEKIYSLLNILYEYAANENAVITDSPMLNIYSKDNRIFYTRVAYPVSKKLESKGRIESKWMMKGGNILTTEVKGGQEQLDKSLHIMEDYMADYTLKSPAIPFYSLISNRLTQKDSTKWLTKIYYPVMYYN